MLFKNKESSKWETIILIYKEVFSNQAVEDQIQMFKAGKLRFFFKKKIKEI